MAFPLSMVSTMARYSKFSSMTLAILFKRLLRYVGEDLPHVLKASCAASRAKLTSALVDLAALVNTLPSIGEMF